MQKLPVTIVAGFLGAGKTTLLNHLLTGDHGLRIAVLVNDFGSIEVDSQLIRNVDGQTIGLANGCVCCTIRDDLVQALGGLLERDGRFDHIVIETSGVSDPAAAAMGVVMSTRLASRLRLDAIVTVVDAENVLGLQGEHRALAVDQVKAADLVLMNKRDLVGPAILEQVRSWVRGEAPHARLIATEQSRVPLQLLLDAPEERASGSGRFAPGADHDHGVAHDVTSWSWEHHEPLALEPLYQLLQRLPPEVFRAKGILNLAEVPNRRVVLQVVGKRIQLSKGSPWTDEAPLSRLVMLGLGRGVDFAAVSAGLEQCLQRNAPPSTNRLVEAVLTVLRGT